MHCIAHFVLRCRCKKKYCHFTPRGASISDRRQDPNASNRRLLNICENPFPVWSGCNRPFFVKKGCDTGIFCVICIATARILATDVLENQTVAYLIDLFSNLIYRSSLYIQSELSTNPYISKRRKYGAI